jgi:hypothetical protein
MLIAGHIALAASSQPSFELKKSDIVAFIGGADVAAQNDAGHLETILSAQFPGALFRNLGWEGDTVFAQPRDINFPDLVTSLQRVHATVVILQFGRTEALKGVQDVRAFSEAYDKLLTAYFRITPRLLLVTPPPYENGGDLLPKSALRNRDLEKFVEAIRSLAARRNLRCVDAFTALSGMEGQRLTENGMQLSLVGHAMMAGAFARELGFGAIVERAGPVLPESGAFTNPAFEGLRQQVLRKDRLWFNYYRPQNWAFLGGDRTSQPSSRDHRNPNVRWFPEEMEKFLPLIQAGEEQILKVSSQIQ